MNVVAEWFKRRAAAFDAIRDALEKLDDDARATVLRAAAAFFGVEFPTHDHALVRSYLQAHHAQLSSVLELVKRREAQVSATTVRTEEWRVPLWDTINQYVRACGGDPSDDTVSNERMDAVRDVERALELAVGRALEPSVERPENRLERVARANDAMRARFPRKGDRVRDPDGVVWEADPEVDGEAGVVTVRWVRLP